MKQLIFMIFYFLMCAFLCAGERPDSKTVPIPIPGACPERGYARRVVSELIEIKGDYGHLFTHHEEKYFNKDIKRMQSKKLTREQAALLIYCIRVESNEKYGQKKIEKQQRRSECEKKRVSRVRRAQSV